MRLDREGWLSLMAAALGLGASACRGEAPRVEACGALVIPVAVRARTR